MGTDHILALKKRDAKIKKEAEKRAKKAKETGETVEGEDDENFVAKKREWFSYEIGQCEWLLKYFRSMTGEGVAAAVEKTAQPICANSKLDEDLKKGGLTVMTKNADGVDMSKGFKNKKKENKKASSMLTFDITLITRVKDLGLSPPMNTENVNAFIGELEGKLKFFFEEAVKKTEERAEIEAANAVKAAETVTEEAHVEETA